jgi:lysyl-tRNA synthetase class 1
MYGKDLIDSAKLSSKIVRIMGKQPPNGFFYELFLDEEGRKISKSKGKGLTIETWTSYAPLESLLYYLFQNPKQAKRLFWGVVPKSVDEYLQALRQYPKLDLEKKPSSAVWHIFNQGKDIPEYHSSINFSLINNLISAVGAEDIHLILDYLKRYDSDFKEFYDLLVDLVKKGMNYYSDIIEPTKQYRTPNKDEEVLFKEIYNRLKTYEGYDEDELQSIPFDVAREYEISVKDLFKLFYEVILGQERGPRFGTFTCLVRKENVLSLLKEKAIITGIE